MKTLGNLRTELRNIGFNVQTQTLSTHRHATYYRLSDRRKLPTIFTSETLSNWKLLLDFKREHKSEIALIASDTGIVGLV